MANIKFFTFTLFCGKLLEIPFELFSNFYIEKKFGFNKMTLKLYFIDFLKGYFLSVLGMNLCITILEAVL